MSSNEEVPNQPSTSEQISTSEQPTEQSALEVNANAGSLEVSEDKSSVSDEYIRLRVITSEMTNEVHFRVKSATTLGRLKRSYCSKLGFQVDELRFVFDGHRITDDDTPKSLGMINDDVIEIYQERSGGM
ncbi:small ubiquitin-related modifier-like [Sipha flava]|jgi:small ubiquitin-related modifier|uniref:Small ubiquitin-related modifier n=1 Tax=Sipha flava TaxID=143950 RepID=A0A2S2Q7Y5_9HEMI|nr:small ubiquitin-related modifier-like [Sipha flava]XP_025417284.1 small ubiquitin-related modifier-like [Sipha flava]